VRPYLKNNQKIKKRAGMWLKWQSIFLASMRLCVHTLVAPKTKTKQNKEKTKTCSLLLLKTPKAFYPT
jgi:hypothetical protein